MKIAKVQIEWFISRKEIPAVSKKKYNDWIYNPIIVFDNQYNVPIWDNNVSTVPLWTCVVHNKSIKGHISIAEIKYLSESAPQELMQMNAGFELYEGKSKVAKGIILELIE
ncbi:MAG: hypothetical protein OSJ68_05735 [Clostridia bacterium]|nr:hypothetical protein [Clostridia bacterium]